MQSHLAQRRAHRNGIELPRAVVDGERATHTQHRPLRELLAADSVLLAALDRHIHRLVVTHAHAHAHTISATAQQPHTEETRRMPDGLS